MTKQNEDVILHRLKHLIKSGSLMSVSEKSELPEVMRLCKDHESIIIDEDGIICHQVFAKSNVGPTQVLQ